MPPSPSLYFPGFRTAPARETKLLLSSLDQVSRVLEWARNAMQTDPHADLSRGGIYTTSTLYLDTEDLDVFHRRGSHGRHKYRVRRYDNGTLFLERKSKRGTAVKKRRTRISSSELGLLGRPSESFAWDGYWFLRRVRARTLKPVCQINYERAAFSSLDSGNPIRLTLDRQVSCRSTLDFTFEKQVPVPVLAGQAILELKYMGNLPGLFEELIYSLALGPQPVSKYRLSLRTLNALPGTVVR